MLQERAEHYIKSEEAYGEDRALYHYNCAETILYSCDDCYQLGLDAKARKVALPFGGGFYKERACGVLTGGLMALGLLFGEDRPTENNAMKEAARTWVEVFESHFGSTECAAIKLTHRHPQEKCAPVMKAGAQLLETLIAERQEKKEGNEEPWE